MVHAGLYYEPDSLKARTCIRGRELLYRYVRDRGIPHAVTGKLVVATDVSQLEALEQISVNAAASGAGRLERLSARKARSLEPELRCEGALWSPRSGIVDSHALMLSLAGDITSSGGCIVCRTPVERLSVRAKAGITVHTGGLEPSEVVGRQVIVAAGLGGPELARTCVPSEHLPPTPGRFAKGTYFALVGCPPPFRRLVYPIPESGGLGIHATVDLAGQLRFGPDVEWVETVDYRPDPTRAETFYRAVRRYWPGLPDGALVPAYCGIRPKINGPGEPSLDFRVLDEEQTGVEGLTVFLGIESPGLTAALALAELIA